MKKHTLSLTLVIVMLVTMVPVSVFAATDAGYEAVYQWNLAIFSANSTSEEALAFYKQPSEGIQSNETEIIALAKSVTEGKAEDYQKAKAIHAWVTNNIWYDYDLYVLLDKDPDLYGEIAGETQDAISVLHNKYAVCAGYATLTTALLRATGIPAKYVAGYILKDSKASSDVFFDVSGSINDDDGGSSHAWTAAYADGKWISMDTTWDSNNRYENGKYSPQRPGNSDYFDPSLKRFSKDHRLWYDPSVTNVVIPDTVTSIGERAFFNYTALTSVMIPDSVTNIEEWSFRSCRSLANIIIPDSVTGIGDQAFGFTGLTNIVIPGSVTRIGDAAFMSCQNLRDVIIANGVVTIEDSAFSGCAALDEIVIPNSVTFIGGTAFYECTGLTSVTLSSNVTTIGGQTFQGCINLRNIIVPNSVTDIGGGAFQYCTNLTSIMIPESVTSISDWAFVDCANLTIYGKAGSYAEAYAKANNIRFFAGTPLDTAATWAHTEINSAVSKGFVPADIQSDYRNTITRAEFCRMAVKFVEYRTGKPIGSILSDKGVFCDPNAFTDTKDYNILAAYALGITSGTKAPTDTASGTFTPDGEFSREQAATMIMNTCKVIGIDTANPPTSDFTDLSTASTWAVNGINFVRANGIMSGTSTDTSKPTFSPKGTYTRQESIVAFDRIK